jgi:hypothetical protein
MNQKEIEQIQNYAMTQARSLIQLLSPQRRTTLTFKQQENLNNAMTISNYIMKNTAAYLKSGQDLIETRGKELNALLVIITDIITNPDNRISFNNLPTDLQTELQKYFPAEEEASATLWDLFSNLFSLCQNAKISGMETVYDPYAEGGTDVDASTTALEITGMTQPPEIT